MVSQLKFVFAFGKTTSIQYGFKGMKNLSASCLGSRVCVLLGGVGREEGPAAGLRGDEEADGDALLWGVDVSRRCGGSSN